MRGIMMAHGRRIKKKEQGKGLEGNEMAQINLN